jgi:hypothetical protein
MRFAIAALLFSAAIAAPAFAQDARTLYVERRGLVEADAQCDLLDPGPLDALRVGTAQARGSLLRAGWSNAQLSELDAAIAASAQARACNDTRTLGAVRTARAAYTTWANAGRMEFPGWERTWLALRSPDADGWRLRQAIEAPRGAVFGVRDHDGAQALALIVSNQAGAAAPRTARLIMRPRTATLVETSLPARMAYGLAAGAPSTPTAMEIAGVRSVERGRVVFAFPDSAFAALLALDPRESVVIEVSDGRSRERLYVEVGDVGAARAFLTIRR